MEILFTSILTIHIIAGSLSLITFWIPMFVKKGGKLHNQIGRIYVYLMWIVVLTAVILSILNLLRGRFITAGFLGFLAIITAQPLWYGITILKHKKEIPPNVKRISNLFNWILFLSGTGLVLWSFILDLNGFAILLLIFGLLGVISSAPLLFGRVKSKNPWVSQHLENMITTGIAAYTAFFAFGGGKFMGHIFSDRWIAIPWILPTLIGVVLIKRMKQNYSPLKRKQLLKTQNHKTPTVMQAQKKYLILIFILSFGVNTKMHAQIYAEKQSRHRFAQMNVGIDYFSSFGGITNYLNQEGKLQELKLDNFTSPRLLIGGTHFWGHADFLLSFPLITSTYEKERQDILFSSGIDLMFKFYPLRIQHKRLAPYLGSSLSGYTFRQDNLLLDNGIGPIKSQSTFPLLTGICYNYNNHLIELGYNYLVNNKTEYYISPDTKTEISVAQHYMSISYRYMFETSVSAEKDWESGRTQVITDTLASRGKLNNYFLSVGPSSAFQLNVGNYNKDQRPFFDVPEITSFLDYGLGYYFHDPDINLSFVYRAYGGTNNAYQVEQKTHRRSIGFEITKFLSDYHGFVPFIGPVVSLEKLKFEENAYDLSTHSKEQSKLGIGFTFGWDIRPNRIQSFILRTNLRWYPNLALNLDAEQSVSFNALEFNFIQLVVYPQRL